MNAFFKLLATFIVISALPLILTTIAWCLTIGGFTLIATLHHPLFIFVTCIMMFISFIACISMIDEMD
jgi:hypothetical protein